MSFGMDFNAVSEKALLYKDRHLDLRPYMIERPYTVNLRDKFSKALNLFKQMQLR